MSNSAIKPILILLIIVSLPFLLSDDKDEKNNNSESKPTYIKPQEKIAYDFEKLYRIPEEFDYKSKAKLKVLFIGNEIISSHSLPETLSALSKVQKNSKYYIETKRITLTKANLQKHIDTGNASNAVKNDKWDIVIIQGTNDLVINQEQLKEYDKQLTTFLKQIDRNKTKVLLFSTWAPHPSHSQYKNNNVTYQNITDFINKIYHTLAKKHNANVIYNSMAFYKATRLGVNIYKQDNILQNKNGSFLIAAKILKKLMPDSKIECNIALKILGTNQIPVQYCNKLKLAL
jgi:hypothetical protein